MEERLAALYCSRVAEDGCDLLGMPLVRASRPTRADLWDNNYASATAFWCDEGSPIGLHFQEDQWGSWNLSFARREEQPQSTLFGEAAQIGCHGVHEMQGVVRRLSRAAMTLLVEEERERIAAVAS